MESTISNLSPWLLLIALGAFHGLNPAMGWLFAVALGLYRQSRGVVLVSLIPIALGHAAAIAVVVYAVMALGMAIDADAMMLIPVLMPLAAAGEHAHHMPATSSLWIASLAVLVHSLAMLLTTGSVALIVYQWAGLDFLRRGWINLDAIWTAALIGMGLWLVLS